MRPRASFQRVRSPPSSSGSPAPRVSRGTAAAAGRLTSSSPTRVRAAGTALLLFLSELHSPIHSNSRRNKEAQNGYREQHNSSSTAGGFGSRGGRAGDHRQGAR